jgi:hypothetical protein
MEIDNWHQTSYWKQMNSNYQENVKKPGEDFVPPESYSVKPP